jgi:fumarate hydratase class II
MKRKNVSTRTESDTMGRVEIPAWAYWGAQTQRAMNNFLVSDLKIPKAMIRCLGMVKAIAARVNGGLGLLDKKISGAIQQAADEVKEGCFDEHFPVDVFQTGSGTSWNMNANEVIANRANEISGRPVGEKSPVHPNDHVNMGQSSNDVIPTCIHLACRMEAEKLKSEMKELANAFSDCTKKYSRVIKLGRTHLQDAVPMTLGQEFSGYGAQVEKGIKRLVNTFSHLEELAIGGTAVGTGLNAHPDFGKKVVEQIAGETGILFKPAVNRFEAIACRDAQVELMGALNTIATSLMKIANDIRLLSSGPRSGFSEILLPSLQPGSSIMPGKVNPVIPEMVIQVAAHVMGKHLAVTIGGQNGPLELNIMQPLIAYETLTSLGLLAKTCKGLTQKCVLGIKANVKTCLAGVEWSLALVTPLALKIGYDKAAHLAYKAFKEGKTIKDVALKEGLLPAEELDEMLNPENMVGD